MIRRTEVCGCSARAARGEVHEHCDRTRAVTNTTFRVSLRTPAIGAMAVRAFLDAESGSSGDQPVVCFPFPEAAVHGGKLEPPSARVRALALLSRVIASNDKALEIIRVHSRCMMQSWLILVIAKRCASTPSSFAPRHRGSTTLMHRTSRAAPTYEECC